MGHVVDLVNNEKVDVIFGSPSSKSTLKQYKSKINMYLRHYYYCKLYDYVINHADNCFMPIPLLFVNIKL